MKNDKQITVHLPDEYHDIILRLADKDGITKSEWVRALIEQEICYRYHQAKNTMMIMSVLENHESFANCENCQSSYYPKNKNP